MTITFHKIPNLPFYSLNEFTQLQPLSRGKSPIYLYQHNQSNQIFVVKEIPFDQNIVKVYEVLFRLYGLDCVVKMRGLCKMVIKYEKMLKKRNHQISELSLYGESKEGKDEMQRVRERKESQQKNKQEEWLLLFMEKCQENMLEHMKKRRRERRPFKCQQVTNFINQTLFLLETLQKENISHRDIKPENFLFDKGKFKLCDFENALYLDPLLPVEKRKQLDLTTVEYTSPQFFRNLKHPKDKIFNPFKLDLYALGVTILYICSMGKFDLSERRQYLEEDSVFHSNFMKEQRRRYLKNNDEFKSLSTIVKIMLEEDEYKRDTFITLLMKIKPILSLRELEINVLEEEAVSENSKSEESRRKLANAHKKSNRKRDWEGTTQIQKKSLNSLLILALSFFVLLFII